MLSVHNYICTLWVTLNVVETFIHLYKVSKALECKSRVFNRNSRVGALNKFTDQETENDTKKLSPFSRSSINHSLHVSVLN
jgi:hypothetical protein